MSDEQTNAAIVHIVRLLGAEKMRGDAAEAAAQKLTDKVDAIIEGTTFERRRHAEEVAGLAAEVDRLQQEKAHLQKRLELENSL